MIATHSLTRLEYTQKIIRRPMPSFLYRNHDIGENICNS